jgi:dolichyl-phosphate beta-glucosyltransferase
LIVLFIAPVPRPPFASEREYITTKQDGSVSHYRPLPCWHDKWEEHRKADPVGNPTEIHTGTIDEAEVEMSVIIPAYNEEDRLEIMLEEAVAFLDAQYGRVAGMSPNCEFDCEGATSRGKIGGYEILLVNDGSRDRTVDVALAFSAKNKLHDIMRVCTLKQNRGKGGAVTHGLRHARGAYAIFADADGASRFEDLAKLVKGCDEVADEAGRGIAVGSRAHLVGSEATVKVGFILQIITEDATNRSQRSALRNALMYGFHFLLRLLTPPATSRIRDTQCGFKLFTRSSLPHIIPYMHAEGWIFDVEMLMLAESAPATVLPEQERKGKERGMTLPGIRVAEVQIGWKEVEGSKLNVFADSLGMAYGLAILRAAWLLGVYKRR